MNFCDKINTILDFKNIYIHTQVADCVCLMSLDKTCAVPVDTHVWKFAAKHYLPALKMAKTLTTKRYQEISMWHAHFYM